MKCIMGLDFKLRTVSFPENIAWPRIMQAARCLCCFQVFSVVHIVYILQHLCFIYRLSCKSAAEPQYRFMLFVVPKFQFQWYATGLSAICSLLQVPSMWSLLLVKGYAYMKLYSPTLNNIIKYSLPSEIISLFVVVVFHNVMLTVRCSRKCETENKLLE